MFSNICFSTNIEDSRDWLFKNAKDKQNRNGLFLYLGPHVKRIVYGHATCFYHQWYDEQIIVYLKQFLKPSILTS